jgi:NADH-quinone oxidoreductase subunit M
VLPVDYQLWLFAAFFVGFAIKVPMFPFHTWLPYAHGQAPTIGSVILAAVLLKMGTYGFVRFSLPMFPDASVMAITPIAILSIIMIIYTAMVAYAQKDMKQVIAYSSVSHMGIIMLGIFAMNAEGISGSVFQMLSHGIVSGALFMLVGVIYDRRHTKMMDEFGGLASVMPKYAVIFGIMLMASVGLPLTIGFVGEFLVLLGFYQISPIMTILAGTSIIIGAIYMLSVFKKTFFGPITNEANRTLKDLNAKETMSLVPLVLIVIWLGIYPKPVLGPIDNSVKAMLQFMDEKAITVEAKDIIRTAKTKITIEEVK